MFVCYVWDCHLTAVCLPLCGSPKPVHSRALNKPSFNLFQVEMGGGET